MPEETPFELFEWRPIPLPLNQALSSFPRGNTNGAYVNFWWRKAKQSGKIELKPVHWPGIEIQDSADDDDEEKESMIMMSLTVTYPYAAFALQKMLPSRSSHCRGREWRATIAMEIRVGRIILALVLGQPMNEFIAESIYLKRGTCHKAKVDDK